MSMITPRGTTVVLYQGDDLENLAELRQETERARREVLEHQEAVRTGSARHGDAPSDEDAKQAYNAAVEAAAERAVIVRIQAIGRKKFRELVGEHPARTKAVLITRADGEQVTEQQVVAEDASWGINLETFPMALLTYVDADTGRRTISEPDFAGRNQLTEFLEDEITDGQFEDLWITAWTLNRSGGADPKATLYSTGSPSSE